MQLWLPETRYIQPLKEMVWPTEKGTLIRELFDYGCTGSLLLSLGFHLKSEPFQFCGVFIGGVQV